VNKNLVGLLVALGIAAVGAIWKGNFSWLKPTAPPAPVPAKSAKAATPVPTPPPTGQFVKKGVIMSAQEALTEADLSLMLRSAVPHAAIAEDIRKRGLLVRIQGEAATRLKTAGASNGLLALAADWAYVLTDAERQRAQMRMGGQAARAADVAAAARAEEEARRQRDAEQRALRQQTLEATVAGAERAQGDRAARIEQHAKRKAALEAEIREVEGLPFNRWADGVEGKNRYLRGLRSDLETHLKNDPALER
jgi:hypothetical protein